ncbi:putative heat shock factor [Lyophyllum shimeji]|uniref:Heat shock factor n=1 Tax=Lyophyllum shimeji TaxID=47721 RepID=A0A9P3UIK4_LYOSH|nr:putative heat shock factor [Lyophyllum shimeji]
MATGQVALARHRTPIPPQKSSRPVVPAFLQKLHEMVNDPNNADLIRWSEAGDSFYVLDHERFAREVLGRWFKHQNFASFVRQLNMYGFHKIPHLQQGVLRSDSDTEFWNFAHANFHRGQPDLLCLIQRKKQSSQPGDDAVMDLRESSNAGPTQANLANGQVVDIQSIVNGIAAIKRHQSAISSELNELKRSNQLLWQDAMDARAKHQKQQDTINRIVKFLAGVFGNRTSPHKEDVVDSMPSRAVVPRRRFLIEGARSGKVSIEDERDVSENGYNAMADKTALNHYPTIETPQSVPSPSASDRISPDEFLGTYHPPTSEAPYPPQQPAPSPTTSPSETTSSASHETSFPGARPYQPTNDAIERSVTPNRTMNMDFDPRIQVVLNQLTPTQIQQLLSSISHTMDPALSSDPSSSSQSQLTQYTPTADLFNQFINPSSPSPKHATPAPTDGLLSFDDHQDTMNNIQDGATLNVAKHWKAAEDIERDVSAMNTDIDTFIRGLGLDPQHLATTGSANSSPSTASLHLETEDARTDAAAPHSHSHPPPPMETGIHPEATALPATATGEGMFDFDSFLSAFGGTAGNPETAFSADGPGAEFNDLEHVSLDPRPQPPLPAAQPVPIPVDPVRAKRKSDAASELAAALPATTAAAAATTVVATDVPAPKPSKRRRNK